MFELHSIESACRIPGGLRSLKIVDPNDLATQPTWNVAQDAGELDFLPGKSAYLIEQDFRSGSLEGQHDTASPAGDFFLYRLQAQIRAIRPTVESLRAKLVNRRVHLVATYMDDLQRLIPYMRISINDNSGSRRGDKQGYNLTGTSRLLMPGSGLGGNIATVAPPSGGVTPPTIEAGNVEIVTITTTDASYTYNLPGDKWLVGWEVRSTMDQTVSLGLTASGDELGGPVEIPTPEIWVGQGNSVPTFNSYNIYFSGLQGTNEIKLWLLSNV